MSLSFLVPTPHAQTHSSELLLHLLWCERENSVEAFPVFSEVIILDLYN